MLCILQLVHRLKNNLVVLLHDRLVSFYVLWRHRRLFAVVRQRLSTLLQRTCVCYTSFSFVVVSDVTSVLRRPALRSFVVRVVRLLVQLADSSVDERVADLVLQFSLVVLDHSRVQVFLLQNKKRNYLDEVFDVELSAAVLRFVSLNLSYD